jgi:hypothetical protein
MLHRCPLCKLEEDCKNQGLESSKLTKLEVALGFFISGSLLRVKSENLCLDCAKFYQTAKIAVATKAKRRSNAS